MKYQMNKLRQLLAILMLSFIFLFAGCAENNKDNEKTPEVPTIEEPTPDVPVDPTPDKPTPENEVMMSEDYPYICKVIGEGYIVYSNDDENPYNVDLDKYGSDIRAIFYEPDFSDYSDPYVNVEKSSFYNDYDEALTYEDSYYRSLHKLMSGDITPQNYLTISESISVNEINVRITTATYLLSTSGEFIGYIPNLTDTPKIIFYGGAYTSLNDVAAYLLAFGEVPVNSNYNKNKGRETSVQEWGEYGRVNLDIFSGDTQKYPYEPLLPSIGVARFRETDFGTLGGYENYNSITGTRYVQKIYNDGKQISRGAARFVFTDITSVSSIDNRYVFYTYNHYNDFEEYLNYENGFGKRFGNMSAGNEYCGSKSDFNKSNVYPVSLYEQTILMKLEEILKTME